MGWFGLIFAFPIVIGIGAFFGRLAPAYFQGVKGGAVAIAAAFGFAFVAGVLANVVQVPTPGDAPWTILVAPILEEAGRYWLIARSAFLLDRTSAWLAFGLGFGLVEGIGKFLEGFLELTTAPDPLV